MSTIRARPFAGLVSQKVMNTFQKSSDHGSRGKIERASYPADTEGDCQCDSFAAAKFGSI
jgi:hypothetical protein